MARCAKEKSESTEQPRRVRPFLKWVGGKAQLLDDLMSLVPAEYGRYHEPFLGGGALFFALSPAEACLSDINAELINAYTAVRDETEALIDALNGHEYGKEHYYRVRQLDRSAEFAALSSVERAARLIYLNKTCYNGLYRVNSKGHFNVPIGDYRNPTICDREGLLACSEALAGAVLSCASFSAVLENAAAGDLVYFDPPYAPLSSTSNFTSYSQSGFGPAEQAELVSVCEELDKKGVRFILSNSKTSEVQKRCAAFRQLTVTASRAVNSKAEKRGAVEELIVINF